MDKRIITLIALAMLPILLLEIGCRCIDFSDWFELNWYPKKTPLICKTDRALLFIGNSRVAGAIDEASIEKGLQESKFDQVRVFNLGLGYTNSAEQYFAIQDLSERRENGLRGCTVFVEAPGGIADDATWNQSWVRNEEPKIIVPFLPVNELLRFCLTETSIESKCYVLLAKASKFMYKQRQIQNKIINTLRHLFDKGMEKRNTGLLSNSGGIRNDSNGIVVVRKAVMAGAVSESKTHGPVDWNNTVTHDFVRFVQTNGGVVKFFYMPVSTCSNSPLRQNGFDDFKKAAESWNCEYFPVDFKTNDNDFPDLLHLGKPLVPAYNKALLKAIRANEPDDKH